jgi:hypothetical protein
VRIWCNGTPCVVCRLRCAYLVQWDTVCCVQAALCVSGTLVHVCCVQAALCVSGTLVHVCCVQAALCVSGALVHVCCVQAALPKKNRATFTRRIVT